MRAWFNRLSAYLAAFSAVCLLIAVAAFLRLRPSRYESLDEMSRAALTQLSGEITLPGLQAEVEVLRDTWGVPHIYAKNQHDLFFAQGFVQAQDRLWQMDVWRRIRDGTMAESAGQRAVSQDSLARMLMYRAHADSVEWQTYHPRAKEILEAFASGVNAYIDVSGRNLPVEFTLTGTRPGKWTAQTPLLRTPTFADAADELSLAMQVHSNGLAAANRRWAPRPHDELRIPNGLDTEDIVRNVVTAAREPASNALPSILEKFHDMAFLLPDDHSQDSNVESGSNNWVVSGARSTTGKPILANDPHRRITLPALRYLVHLNAPGWNVIGATEPAFPGVVIGHNGKIAWGMTTAGFDVNDVVVEELDSLTRSSTRLGDGWVPIKVIHDTVIVRDDSPKVVTIKYSRNGPSFHEDTLRNIAYALRSTMHAPGTASYMAALRLNQVTNCTQFLTEARFWRAPAENLICGDIDGNIAWRASGLAPKRENWSGRLPVPGTGQYEWSGFRDDLPQELNPRRGFIATANNDIHPPGYGPPLMYKKAGPEWRYERIVDILQGKTKFSPADFSVVQQDVYSNQAAGDQKLFRGWSVKQPHIEWARNAIASWDARLTAQSKAAALYSTWLAEIDSSLFSRPATGHPRDSMVAQALIRAVSRLRQRFGVDTSTWTWGKLNAQTIHHRLATSFSLPSVDRQGGLTTIAANGASYRQIINIASWDSSMVINVPGQSGQPHGQHYADLLPLWRDNKYHPLLFSRSAVEKATEHRLLLRPGR